MVQPGSEARLLEREGELAETAAALERARAGTGSVVIAQGPAGIGKTQLARAARARALEEGMSALWARGGELERDFPYGVVRQLFESPLAQTEPDKRDQLLSGAARLAAAVIGDDESEVRESKSSLDSGAAILHGLYWLTSNLAEEAPLLVCVDDVHWADAASLSFLIYLARRIEQLPVCLLVTERRPEAGIDDAALARLATQPASILIRPGSLSPDAVASLVRDAVDARAEDEFCIGCYRATGGNPFLVHELVRAIQAERISPVASEAATVERLAPGTVARSMLVRLARLSEDARRVARVLTVLGSGADQQIAARLADLDLDDAARAADALTQAGILTGPSLEFVHPLIRQAVSSEVPAFERASLHARAARLLSEVGAPASEVAAHLLATEPGSDPWVVDVLRAGARKSLFEGAPQTAIAHLKRALAEPPADEARPDVLLELGRAQAVILDVDAIATLEAALQLGIDPAKRAEVALQLARAIGMTTGDVQSPYEILAGIDTADLDPDLALRTEGERIGLALGTPHATVAAARASELAPLANPPRPASTVLLANLGMLSLTLGGTAEQAADFAMKALQAGLIDEQSFQFNYAGRTLICAERFEDAARILDDAIEDGVRRGSLFLVADASMQRGHLRFRLGQLRDAEADLRLGLEMLEREPARQGPVTLAAGFLVNVLVERGDLVEAETMIERIRLPDYFVLTQPQMMSPPAILRAAQGRVDEAIEHLEPFRRTPVSPADYPWRSTLALLLTQQGKQAEALRLAEEEVSIARDQGLVRGLGIALRALGLVEGGARGLDLLQEAVEVLEPSPAELESARALTDLGAGMRRARQIKEARVPLARGLELAHRCGATPLAERARQELLASGARPRRLAVSGIDALTASERRVAQLAAQGLSNREIAQSLFVSVRTVATHLTSTYQKLGVGGREELVHALPDPRQS